MVEFLVAVIVMLFFLLFLQEWTIVLMNRKITRLEKRPVGRIISSKLTDEGLMVEGEIWDEETRRKISQGVITNFSVGPIQPADPNERFGSPKTGSDHGQDT